MNDKFYEIICRDDSNSPVQILLHGEIGLQNFEKGKIHSNEFIEEIMSIPRERKIQIRMNSIGGSFLDGLAIGKAIRERGNVECHVDGCCASAATIPAFCCSRVTASDGAFFLLHESRGSVENKTADNLRNLANQLDDKNRIMAEVYATKTGRPIESFFEIMREEKILTAQEALQLGLVDEIIPVTAQSTNNITAKADMNETENKTPEQGQNESITAEIQAKLDAEIAQKAEIEAKLKAAQDEMAKIKADRIRSLVCDAIDDQKIKNTEREAWISACMKDESMIERLNNLPPMNFAPVEGNNIQRIEHGRDSLAEITARSIELGDSIEGRNYRHENADVINAALAAESPAELEMRAKGYAIRASGSTVDSHLKVPFLHEKVIYKLDYDLGNIFNFFTTLFDVTPIKGKYKKVVFPVLPLSSETVKTWDGEYADDAGQETDYKEVEINKWKYVPLTYDAETLADLPAALCEEKLWRNYSRLYKYVWEDVISLITPTNFPNMVCNALKVAANAFDITHLAKLRNHLLNKNWPYIKLFLHRDYEAGLISNSPIILNSSATQRPSPVVTGKMFTPCGFEYYESNSNIPNNSVNLYGFAVTSDAILFAAAPVIPPDEANQVGSFSVVQGPNSKIPFLRKKWFDNKHNKTIEIIETRYGAVVGDNAAGCPLVSA